MPTAINVNLQDAFITEYFANGCRKRAAARTLEIQWSTVKAWFKNDTEFVERVNEFRDMWLEELRAAAFQRAMAKSDMLMMFMLKSLNPEEYDDNIRRDKWRIENGATSLDAESPIQVVMLREPEPWKKPEGDSEPQTH
jgi:hypothetical protein